MKRVLLIFIIMPLTLFADNLQKSSSQKIKFADDRLLVDKSLEDIESTLNLLKIKIVKNGENINKEKLEELIENIKIIRNYGKDISKKAKNNLLEILKVLKAKSFDKTILQKLEDITKTSQLLIG